MIIKPRLSEKQLSDIKDMMKTEGWRIVNQMLEGSIEYKNVELQNFNFRFDDDGEVVKKSVLDHQNKKKEADILKELLQFLKNPAIVKKESSKDVYE